jgi:hypothetical protein
MSKKALLIELVGRGKPLADVDFVPVEGENYEELIRVISELAPDLDADIGGYNSLFLSGGYPHLRPFINAVATKEALERLFGWVIRRAPLPKWDSSRQAYDGYHEDAFYWEEVQCPQYFPAQLDGRIERMGLSQPGANDDGNDDLVTYLVP